MNNNNNNCNHSYACLQKGWEIWRTFLYHNILFKYLYIDIVRYTKYVRNEITGK